MSLKKSIQIQKFLLPTLLLISGFCGISYEILYAKLLINLLGGTFVITASVLITFMLGIGLGSLLAHRLVRRLWMIEAGIGLYALAMILSYHWIDQLIYASAPGLATSLGVSAAISIVLLIFPALLIGCSVPIFSAYLSNLRSRNAFSITYGIYNLGAALTAMLLEFFILRHVGLRTAILTLALINILVASALFLWWKNPPPLQSPLNQGRPFFSKSILWALSLAGIASAIFQLQVITLSENILGPFNETFSLVLANIFLGLTLGSAFVAFFKFRLDHALLLSLIGFIALLALQDPLITWYASTYPQAAATHASLVLLKFIFVSAMTLPAATGFGAIIPSLLKTNKNLAVHSGFLLSVAAMANAFGFLLMTSLLHQNFNHGQILLMLCTLIVIALVVYSNRSKGLTLAGLGLLIFALISQHWLWSENLWYLGHGRYVSEKKLKKFRKKKFDVDVYKGPQDVFGIVYFNNNPYFFINGYISIALNSPSEMVVGALSSMLAPRLNQALVLGVGSGATASTVGMLFQETDAIEINKVVLNKLNLMKKYNSNIKNMPQVNLYHDDGIRFIKKSKKKYDLILNTVTSPLYFSSSKLYSSDFLKQMAGRLKPDGVYTTWLDGRVGQEGTEIILETLGSVFNYCWVSQLKSQYFMMTCSNQKISLSSFKAVIAHKTLRQSMAQKHGIKLSMLPYSVLNTHILDQRRQGSALINTLDFPVLEHKMSNLRERNLSLFVRKMAARFQSDEIKKSLGEEFNWQLADFVLWTESRMAKNTDLRQLLARNLSSENKQLGTAFGTRALELATSLDQAKAYLVYGKVLFERGYYKEAEILLEKAVARNPALRKVASLLRQCRQALKRKKLLR